MFCKGFMFVLCYLYLLTYTDVHTRVPYQTMFVPFNSNTMGGTCEAETTEPSETPEFTVVGIVLLDL